jgi:hypothetical protein
MSLHPIRLQGPWIWRQSSAEGNRETSLTLPGPLPETAGEVSLVRRFQWLARLEPGEGVFLELPVELVGWSATVNGILGRPVAGGLIDVTAALQRSNELLLQGPLPLTPRINAPIRLLAGFPDPASAGAE